MKLFSIRLDTVLVPELNGPVLSPPNLPLRRNRRALYPPQHPRKKPAAILSGRSLHPFQLTQKIIFRASCVLNGSPAPIPGAPYALPIVVVIEQLLESVQ